MIDCKLFFHIHVSCNKPLLPRLYCLILFLPCSTLLYLKLFRSHPKLFSLCDPVNKLSLWQAHLHLHLHFPLLHLFQLLWNASEVSEAVPHTEPLRVLLVSSSQNLFHRVLTPLLSDRRAERHKCAETFGAQLHVHKTRQFKGLKTQA